MANKKEKQRKEELYDYEVTIDVYYRRTITVKAESGADASIKARALHKKGIVKVDLDKVHDMYYSPRQKQKE